VRSGLVNESMVTIKAILWPRAWQNQLLAKLPDFIEILFERAQASEYLNSNGWHSLTQRSVGVTGKKR